MAELHIRYYACECGFGVYFEAKVARELGEFCQRYDERRDGLWLALHDDVIVASIAIDGQHTPDEGAHLRWFVAADEVRGTGIGNVLLRRAIEFCEAGGQQRIYLWTFEGLHAARHLYEKSGFVLVEQFAGKQWGIETNEQRFELRLGARRTRG